MRRVSGPFVVILLFALVGGLTPSAPAAEGPEIVRVSPEEASWGDLVVVSGRGFGSDPGTVAFGGELSQGIFSWTDTRIEVRVPSRTPSGIVEVEVSSTTRPALPDDGPALVEDLPVERVGAPLVGGPIRVRNYVLPGEEGTYVSGEIVLRVANGVDAGAVLDRIGLRGRWQAARASRHVVATVPPGSEAEEIIAASRDPNIEWAGPHGLLRAVDATPNDLGQAGGQYGLTRIDAIRAWGLQKAQAPVEVGILDTGVAAGHEDLSGKVLQPLRNFTGEGSGADDCGHGTHVAGIAAATTNNDTGVASIGWGTRIRSYRVLGNACQGPEGGTDTSTVVNAINQAVADGVEVVNISLAASGGPCPDDIQGAIDAATAAGRLVVAAAGNDSISSPGFPANCQNVIAVAATGQFDQQASFSNWGPMIDIGAPGVSILSTAIPGGLVCGGEGNSRYATCDGTSMAAPFVAGTAALLYAHGANRAEVVAALLNTADAVACLCGAGRLNAGAALAAHELTHWRPWRGLGGRTRAAPDAASWGPDHVDVLVLGSSTDDIHYKRWDRGWRPWTSLGGPVPGGGHPPGAASAPSAVSWGPERTDAFVVGHDGALWHAWYAGGRWWGWRSRGKPPGVELTSAPAATSMEQGHLEIFVVGDDGNLWHRRWSGSAWQGWQTRGVPGAGIASDPTAVSWGPDRMDVFVRDGDGDIAQTLYQQGWRSSWKAFEPTPESAPGAGAWSFNRIDVFFHEGNGTSLRRWSWDGWTWSGVESYGGRLYSAPGVTSLYPGRLDVFVQGSTGEIWQRWRG